MRGKGREDFYTLLVMFAGCVLIQPVLGFEGSITALVTRGGQTETLRYTVSTNCLRIERGENDQPYAKNLVACGSGAVTLLFPHNRSFVRLRHSAAPRGPQERDATLAVQGRFPDKSGSTNLAMITGKQDPPSGPGPGTGSGAPAFPVETGGAAMRPMGSEPPAFKVTKDTTNLLGYVCARYELRQRGELMDVWATDRLVPFQVYLQNQPRRFGPGRIEEQWGELLKARNLFPLLAVLRVENIRPDHSPPAAGPERWRFEVNSISPGQIEDKDGALFQPPPDYQELEPFPF